MKLTPLADNVVLKRFEAEEKTASGIILSTANKEKSALCEVVAVGPGKKDEPMTVKAGLEKCVNTLNDECDFDFYRVACSTFDRNLRLVDSRFPQVLANALLRYFFGEGTTCLQIVDAMERDDVIGIGEGMYKHLFKKFLCAVALGMEPAEEWNGCDDASKGYVIVCNDGVSVVFNAYNRDALGSYLLGNTRFGAVSISECDDGLVYEHDGEYFINLSLQIGFP